MKLHSTIVSAALACATFLPPASADVVLDWNNISAQIIFTGRPPGPSPVLDFSVVQAAVHDAVQAYDNTYEPYATDIDGATGSPTAAVAKAARDVLANRFPAKAAEIDTAYLTYLAASGISADDPGVTAGAAAAAGVIALRANDGSFPNPEPVFTGAVLTGVWRPTPPAGASMAAPWIAGVVPFVVESAEEFTCDPPAPLNSNRYRKEYNEVKALGALVNSTRTPEQTQIAYFWAENFIAQMNRVLHSLSEAHLQSSAERARLFALVWLSAADGLISTWANKLRFPTWRPITAIHEGDTDGNPRTMGDPTWLPLIITPPYPEHCSGANALVAGTMKMLALFFGGDKVTFTVTSNHPMADPKVRTYKRFSHAADDVLEARILQGIHFRSADIEGRQLGEGVSKYVYKNALRPLHSDSDSDDDEDEED